MKKRMKQMRIEKVYHMTKMYSHSFYPTGFMPRFFISCYSNEDLEIVRNSAPRKGNVKLTMAEDGIWQIDTHRVESLALRFVISHCESRLHWNRRLVNWTGVELSFTVVKGM